MIKIKLNREKFSHLLDSTVFLSGDKKSLRTAARIMNVPYSSLSVHRRGSIGVDVFLAIIYYIHRHYGYSYENLMNSLILMEHPNE